MTASLAVGLLVVRVIAGVAFVLHGWPKIHHPLTWMGDDARVPSLFQALAAVAEFGGGVGWILGLFTPLASFGIACTMTVAIGRHAIVRGDAFVNPDGSSYELAAVYLTIAVLLLTVGAGRFSVDHYLLDR